MYNALLTTKLQVPPVRGGLVRRQRLMDRLNDRSGRKLTLVSTPAGFGKTTLLGEWAAGLDVPVAWLSLDEGDNDLTRFITYVVAALQKAVPGVGLAIRPMLRAVPLPPTEALLAPLINDLAGLSSPCVLVLDDYHVITMAAVHEAVSLLLKHHLPEFHLVISTRSDPPLPLARLRARGELVELRAADLSFTVNETVALLNDSLDLKVPTESVRALTARTEGWVAGLHLAALSMRPGKDVHAFVSGFTGSHEHVLDYLAAEVLKQQSPEVREFLLKTCILERMTGPLCDALTDRLDSDQLLQDLAHQNAFVMLLDNERRWYRYHGLLADVLREELSRERTVHAKDLHQRASAWLSTNGYTHEAFRHALAAGDVAVAIELIRDRIFPLLLRDRPSSVSAYLEQVPEAALQHSPWLKVLRAWATAYAGQYHEAALQLETMAEELERPAADTTDSDTRGTAEEERRHLLGYVLTVYAHTLEALGNHESAARLATRALELLPLENLTMRSLATTMSTVADVAGGQPARALAGLREAADIGLRGHDINAAMIAMCNMARTQLMMARLHDAATTCRNALTHAGANENKPGERFRLRGYAATLYSVALREWGNLDEALHYARLGHSINLEWNEGQVIVRGYVTLAQVHRSRGDLKTARETLDAVESTVARLRLSDEVCFDGLVSEKVHLSLTGLDPAEAYRLAGTCHAAVNQGLRFANRGRHLALARLLHARGHVEAARDLLEQFASRAVELGWTYDLIRACVLQSLVYHDLREEKLAMQSLKQALTLGYPEGFVTVFVEGGEPLARLLYATRTLTDVDDPTTAAHSEYAGRLLASFTRHPSPLVHEENMVEPLTQRELEVLNFLARGRTYQQVADELFITLATVKTHTRSIYSKLGVGNRTQAVNRGRLLGLLPPLQR